MERAEKRTYGIAERGGGEGVVDAVDGRWYALGFQYDDACVF